MIVSILDTDQYKCSQQQFVLELYPNAQVTYKFKNRGTQRFNWQFLEELKNAIENMEMLYLTTEEYDWLKKTCPYFKPMYLEYLKNYRFNPEEVKVSLSEDNNLCLDISGPWHSTILWEVPLLALISEIYFKVVETDWMKDGRDAVDVIQKNRAGKKAYNLEENNAKYIEFGTRRRRSFHIQDLVVEQFKNASDDRKSYRDCSTSFMGTSNVHLAMKYGLKPIGSIAHELVSSVAILESINHANRFAMKNWQKVYGSQLGIALTDTFGTDAFLRDFDYELASSYAGCRQDSGDVYIFAKKIIAHYKKLGIDPRTKMIVFSDSLDVQKAVEINNFCREKINCCFGIGTAMSNDVPGSPPLNIVIKLDSSNGESACKLSDCPGKETGDPEMVQLYKKIYKIGEK